MFYVRANTEFSLLSDPPLHSLLLRSLILILIKPQISRYRKHCSHRSLSPTPASPKSYPFVLPHTLPSHSHHSSASTDSPSSSSILLRRSQDEQSSHSVVFWLPKLKVGFKNGIRNVLPKVRGLSRKRFGHRWTSRLKYSILLI